MSEGDWKSRAVDPSQGTGDWKSRAIDPTAPVSNSSNQVDPAAQTAGLGNFLSFGYAPELQARAEQLYPGPNDQLDQALRSQGFKIKQPGNSFEDLRAENISHEQKLKEQSPYSYYSGMGAGALLTAPLYGAGFKALGIGSEIAPAAQGAGLMERAGVVGSKIAQGAKQGAVMGLVQNPNTEIGQEGFNPAQRVENVATSGLIGGGVPMVGSAIKGAFTVGKGVGSWVGNKTLSLAGGVKPATINEYLNYSDRINSAPGIEKLKEISDDFVGKLSQDFQDKKLGLDKAQEAYKALHSDLKDAYRTEGLDAREALSSANQTLKEAYQSKIQNTAQDIADSIKNLRSDVSSGSAESFDILSKTGKDIPVAPIKQKITLLMNDLKIAGASAVGEDARAGTAALQEIRHTLDNFPKNLPLEDAKKLLQQLQQSTQYGQGPGTFSQSKDKALKEVNAYLRGKLETTSPEYAEKMKEVAANTGLLNRVSEFQDRSSGAGLLPRLENPNQIDRMQAIKELGSRNKVDYLSAVNPRNLPEQQIVTQAENKLSNLRPDRVSQAIESNLSQSPQQSNLSQAQLQADQSEKSLAPFKSLAPNAAGQTQAQEKLQTMAKGKNIELEGMFHELGKLSNTDFVQAMKDQSILDAFKKGATQGSRRTALGGIVGWFFGGAGGAAIGGQAGFAVDQYGPTMTKHILDGIIKVGKNPTIKTIGDLDLPDSIKHEFVMALGSRIAADKAPMKFNNSQMKRGNP